MFRFDRLCTKSIHKKEVIQRNKKLCIDLELRINKVFLLLGPFLVWMFSYILCPKPNKF